MNAIRTMAVLGFCAVLAGCAGSRHRTEAPPGSITLEEARKGIEEGYRRKREAYVTKDLKAAMALRTEDFVYISPTARVPLDRATAVAGLANIFKETNRWIHLDFTIDSLTLVSQGSRIEADAIMTQHMVRMELWSNNKVHHVDLWNTQRERWRWTPDGWKLARVDGHRDYGRLIDGKSVPYQDEIRAGIEEGYRRNRAAFLAKDVKAIMALRTEDFHTVDPDGTPKDRAAMETYTVGFLNGIDRWIDIEFAIDSLDLVWPSDPPEADVIMRQHLVRMALRPDQKVHHVETWTTQRERWRSMPDGWKLAKVDSVHAQKRLVDGKPE